MDRTASKPLFSVFVAAAFTLSVAGAATHVAAEGAAAIYSDDERSPENDAVEDRAGLVGCYDLTGVDTAELAYSGTLCIEVLGDLLYELTWTLMEEDEGLVVYNGRGVSGGNDLFAIWRESGSEYDCYLYLFDIDVADGTLHGLRVDMNGGTSSQTGTRDGPDIPLDWSEAGQLAGSYVLESSDEYNGNRVTVEHLPIEVEDAYSFTWSGHTEFEGIGVRDGTSISVVANPVGQRGGTCGSITFTRNEDNRNLQGRFFTLDSLTDKTPRLRGEETAVPRK